MDTSRKVWPLVHRRDSSSLSCQACSTTCRAIWELPRCRIPPSRCPTFSCRNRPPDVMETGPDRMTPWAKHIRRLPCLPHSQAQVSFSFTDTFEMQPLQGASHGFSTVQVMRHPWNPLEPDRRNFRPCFVYHELDYLMSPPVGHQKDMACKARSMLSCT